MKVVAMIGLGVLVAVQALAGAEGRGGGNAVVCFSDPNIVKNMRLSKENGGGYIENKDIPYITSVEMLDLRKMKQPRLVNGVKQVKGLLPIVFGETESQLEARVRGRFKDLNPEADKLLERGKNQISEFRGVPNGVAPIDDVGAREIYNTDLCVRATIIAQYYESSKTHVIYDERIYDLPESIFDVQNRVASRWHEYFYSLARLGGATESQATQTLVGRLFLETLTYGELIEALTEFSGSSFPDAGFVSIFAKAVNDDLKNYGLAGLKTEDQFNTVLASFLFPIIGLHLIPAEAAFRIVKHNYHVACDEKFVSVSSAYEERKSMALEVLKSQLVNLKNILPAGSESTYSKISEYYHQKIQSAGIEEKFEVKRMEFEGNAVCFIDDGFLLSESIPQELVQLIYDMSL